jgi:hypothetical protein
MASATAVGIDAGDKEELEDANVASAATAAGGGM